MAYGRNDFDRDFASPADYEDGFRISDGARGERELRRKTASERLRALMAERELESGGGDGKSHQDGLEL